MQKHTELLNILKQKGILLAGVCPFSVVENHLLSCRAKERLPQKAKSILMAAFPYNPRPREKEKGERILARYACVPDYHHSIGILLQDAADALAKRFPEAEFSAFVDNSPIPEVRAAAHCGLGIIGRNGLLIHPEYGSWIFLGEIVTDLEIEPTGTGVQYCKDCGQCAKHCPGKALSGMGPDRSRCVSAILQKKGILSEEEKARIKENGLIWGCDTCQECCPYNQEAKPAGEGRITEGYNRDFWDVKQSQTPKVWEWRGEEILKRNLAIIREIKKEK